MNFVFKGIVPTVEEGKEESDETLSSDAAIAEREKLKKVFSKMFDVLQFVLVYLRVGTI